MVRYCNKKTPIAKKDVRGMLLNVTEYTYIQVIPAVSVEVSPRDVSQDRTVGAGAT